MSTRHCARYPGAALLISLQVSGGWLGEEVCNEPGA